MNRQLARLPKWQVKPAEPGAWALQKILELGQRDQPVKTLERQRHWLIATPFKMAHCHRNRLLGGGGAAEINAVDPKALSSGLRSSHVASPVG